ncbi:MAG: helix-turn-helix domain-containing protein [Chloroflexota bacterium]|nr:helix-turn-helix domain-containing protein [Chloroflexota bacterium]
MPDEQLTPRQVAEELGVTVRTVQRWVADGRLPAARIGGRVRVSRSSLGTVAAASAPDRHPDRPIHSLLIANRGEIVERVARTARQMGIRSIGVHAPDDRSPDGVDLALPITSYLDVEAMLDAARRSGADAIHPGYGFLAENAAFAAAVERAGLTWVGPPAAAIAAMGGKAAARRTAAAHGVPVTPGYDGEAQDDATLAGEAVRIGLPILVKPSAGGGGKGMRVVREAFRLPEELAAARREAQRAFGDDRLILEQLLSGARHVELQVLFDRHGHGVHLGERDCSTQRRNQKIVEESPAPSVSQELRSRMGEAALAVARAVGYANAGTVEFLLNDAGDFYFVEMNTRLQVEHPVTEAVTGRDLVADQLRIAAGQPLGFGQSAVHWNGHAIQVRLYAEDPDTGFLPAAGRVLRVRWPDGVRVDTGIRQGDTVSDRYDPLLAKLIAHGATREESRARLRAALDATLVLGVRTNLRFLRWLLDQPVMRDAQVRTDTLAGLALPHAPEPDAAAWSAGAGALLEAGPGGPWGGGWRGAGPASVRMRYGDEDRRVEPRDDGSIAVAVAGATAYVEVEGQSLELTLAASPSIEEAVRHAADHAGGTATLISPMPGRVIAIRAAEGTSVVAHQPIVVIEAMKMEHAVVTPLAGTLMRVAVAVGQQVQRGDLLAEVSA